MPTPRRLAVMGAGIGTAAIAVLTLLVIVGMVEPVEALLLGALGAVLGGLAFLLLTLRRLDGKVQRMDARVKRDEQKLAEIAGSLAAVAAKLDAIAPTLAEAAVQHDEDLRAVLASLGEDRVNAMFVRREIEAELQEIKRRTEAMASQMDRVTH
ncbi:hypothetical protein Aph01nite_75910 [Acrocarpospora phusangensis]|uniref:Uncharacterized protein n=1 Tax=Acrocarpospora phusangensis TaxID=1070424 RepID=A0A919UP60_9ACTN|nr:hypothetical protein [Acrocarpospora phusangensis]GIH29281.1 hypothetical protein Aph01nite_75910 [Acrocarpospora phusangensis]